MTNQNLTVRAFAFAKAAHGKQKRKWGDSRYIVHPVEVANILYEWGAPPEVVAAGVLHDVLEDTEATHVMLLEKFGERVTDLVLSVTDISNGLNLSRKTRVTMDHEHYANGDADAHLLKLADVLSNVRGIAALAPKFAKVYLPEKRALVAMLTKAPRKYRNIVNSAIDAEFEFLNRLELNSKILAVGT